MLKKKDTLYTEMRMITSTKFMNKFENNDFFI